MLVYQSDAEEVDLFFYYHITYVNNIQATISAVWLAENMSINPKSVNSAISPVQKRWNWVQNSEIECKLVKLKMTDSFDKIELGQTKWRRKLCEDWNSLPKF